MPHADLPSALRPDQLLQQARLTTLSRIRPRTPDVPPAARRRESLGDTAAGVGHRLAESPHLVALGSIVLVGAALRLATLGLQSYRYDEAVTVVRVLHSNFFDTVAAVPGSESTPPLYYLYYMVAWLWSTLFGTAEVQLRSLSALAERPQSPSSISGPALFPFRADRRWSPRRSSLSARS